MVVFTRVLVHTLLVTQLRFLPQSEMSQWRYAQRAAAVEIPFFSLRCSVKT